MVNKKRPEFIESIIELIQNNGKLFTIFSMALIVLSGIAVVEQNAKWWFFVLGIIALFVVVMIYLHARIVVKVVLVSFLNLFMSAASFQVGSYADSTGTGGLVWMSSTLFNFFVLLALSYGLTSGKSRWGTIGISTVLSFIITYILGVGGINLSIAALIGTIASILIFLALYKLGNKNRIRQDNMPTNLLTPTIEEKIVSVFKNNGWDATSLKNKDDSGTILVWEDRAYILYPVYLDESFSSYETKRKSMLTYKNNNINPWLLNLVFTKIPVWKARNANINLILLDLNNNNGRQARVIGAKIPDSNKNIPVAIIPAKSLTDDVENISEDYDSVSHLKLSNRQKHKIKQSSSKIDLKDPSDIITMIDAEMRMYTRPLKEKQKIAVSRIGQIEEYMNKDSTRVNFKKKGIKKQFSFTKKNKKEKSSTVLTDENNQ